VRGKIIPFRQNKGTGRVAFCTRLRDEASKVADALEHFDLTVYSVRCKCGAIDKTQLGVPKEYKIRDSKKFEAGYNPVVQALLLNAVGIDLNVIVGLCIGHDILFTKHSEAPVTTLIVKGDIHEIGKSIVAVMLAARGFSAYDLGVDVPASKFIEEARKVKADIIALSGLMSSTLGAQKDVIDYLNATGEREKFIVMVGGGITTQEWANEIGVDEYADTATKAVKLALELVTRKRALGEWNANILRFFRKGFNRKTLLCTGLRT